MASYTPELQAHPGSAPPPPPPPKPSSHDATRISTPTTIGEAGSVMPGAPTPYEYSSGSVPPPPPSRVAAGTAAGTQQQQQQQQQPAEVPDPGDQWLPQILQDKSKQDLAAILASPALLHALTHSPQTIHPSLANSHSSLQTALAANIDLASHLSETESRLSRQRAATQAQLLSTHALDRQWRQKQSDMDHALAPFAPASLYQRVSQGVQEQAAVCRALEESFLEGEEEGSTVTEREVADWVRRYREARVQYYLRQERKERWDEGRVGGWR